MTLSATPRIPKSAFEWAILLFSDQEFLGSWLILQTGSSSWCESIQSFAAA